jgi:RNA polymerase-binding protein DksA
MKETYLQTQKRKLEDLRGRLRDEILRMFEAVQEDVRPPGEHEQWIVPSESVDKEVALENTEESLHRAVNAAIDRIENGTYGFCEACGRRISKGRLDAIPFAENCVECERELHLV